MGAAIFDDELGDEESTEDAESTDEETAVEENVLYSYAMSFDLPDTFEELSESVKNRFFTIAGAGNVQLSNDRQWIVGVNSNYEYITADKYAAVQEWLSKGEITQAQADMYWTRLSYTTHQANVLDETTGKPVGTYREYIGFQLTDGNKMEVLSDWYGKTVYFRQVNTPGNGTAIKIPAGTVVMRESEDDPNEVNEVTEQYKKAVTHLNAYIGDTGAVYYGGLATVGNDFWYEDGTHIRGYITNVEAFNRDPEKYLVDAEGNFRMDSFSWGPGTGDEPDLSGRAFWCLLNYIHQGYGMMIGHDTMYGYAGTYDEAYPGYVNVHYGMDPWGNWHYDGDGSAPFAMNGATHYETTATNGAHAHYVTVNSMREFIVPGLDDPNAHDDYRHETYFYIIPINKNDTTTRYYQVNSYPINTGHWNMNALMGSNSYTINTYNEGQGYIPPSVVEPDTKNPVSGYWFFLIDKYSDPYSAPSQILSAGTSMRAPYYKEVMYGSETLRIKSYPYNHQDAVNYARRRTPTNYPYDFNGAGATFPAQATHSNMQVAFGNIWVEYADNAYTSQFGAGRLISVDVEGRHGTNNFYLAGNGTFLMNQIGHLPYNTFTYDEAKLLVNTVMYISQRKQCEICQSNQIATGATLEYELDADADPEDKLGYYEDVWHPKQGDTAHFVHRVDMSNAREVFDALARGGTFWYPLDDCYVLTDDIYIKQLYAPGEWKGIPAFHGHWDNDIYKIVLPEEEVEYTAYDKSIEPNSEDDHANQEITIKKQVPVFVQGFYGTWNLPGFKDGVWNHYTTYGPGIYLQGPFWRHRYGNNDFSMATDNWILGSDSTKSVGYIALDGVRTTAIARVLGYLSDLFEKGNKGDYAGYKLELRAVDNQRYFSEEEVERNYTVTSTVNSDGRKKSNCKIKRKASTYAET